MRICQPDLIAPFRKFISSRCVSCALLIALLCASMPAAGSGTPPQEMQDVVTLFELREFSKAIELLRVIESRVPNSDGIAQYLAIAYLGRGNQLLALGDFPSARAAFQEGRRYDQDDVRFWQGEATACYRQGQYAEAAALLDQALGIAPQNPGLYHQLGATYYAEGRMAEALDALTRSNELGGGGESDELLLKVRKEWRLEQNMDREVRGHFQLSFVDNDQVATIATAILETLEEAYVELGSELSYYPDVSVPVLIYSHRDFSAVTNSPDWAGAVYDGKIRLPIGGLSQMNDQLEAVLYHEYAHVLVHYRTNRNVPVWLNEGLAELAGRRRFSPPLTQLQMAIEHNRLIGWDDLAKPFTGFSEDRALLAYEQSYSLVRFLVESFGWHKISELLERLGKQQQWQIALADVYREYGLDWPAILKEWQLGVR
jgi:tetratricopeptide (TPR) repeat protein